MTKSGKRKWLLTISHCTFIANKAFLSHFIQFKSTHVTAIPAKMAPLVRMMLTTSPNTNVSAKIGSLEQTVKVMLHLNLKVVDSFIL